MKAITVRQPWAWAIICGGKDVENRSRNIAGAYRGPLAIHAGRLYTPTDTWPRDTPVPPAADELPLGAITGLVDLVAVHHSSDHGNGDAARCSAWAQDDDWHLVLANPRPLDQPVWARGALGLWNLSHNLTAQVEAALA